jgi:hypothetical protein
MSQVKVQAIYELWQHKHEWFRMYLEALSDKELKTVPAEGMNHGVWMLAHLLMDEDNLSDYLGLEPIYYPEYQEKFAPGQPIPPVSDCPAPGQLREQWREVEQKNEQVFEQLTDEELKEPHVHFQAAPDQPIETKQLCIMNRILHTAHHAGQLALILKKHGRNIF